jgi:hypothetical protein
VSWREGEKEIEREGKRGKDEGEGERGRDGERKERAWGGHSLRFLCVVATFLLAAVRLMVEWSWASQK